MKTSKNFVGAVSVLCLLAILAVEVQAQPGPGGPGGPGGGRGMGMMRGNFGGGMGMMFRNEECRKYVGLSAEQVEKLQAAAEESRNAMRDLMPRRGDNAGRPSPEEMEKRMAEFAKLRESAEAKMKEILTPEQQEKAATLRFQIAGGLEAMNLDASSLDVLKLSPEQKDKINAIEQERQAERRAAMANRGPVDWRNLSQEDRDKMFAEGQALNKKFADKMVTVLTAEQKEKAAKLTAEAADVREKLGIPGFGGGRRGGRGPGQGGGPGYQPGNDSWRPGQGGPGRQGNRPRRAFPQSENAAE